jgi:hypothetical protein
MKRKNFTLRALIILGFAISGIIFNSCKKEETNESTYYVRFNADGTRIEFNIHGLLVAAFGQSGDQYNSVFTGGDNNSNISLQVFDNKSIAPVTYNGYSLSGSAFVGALIGYQDKNGILYTQGTTNPNSTITITELTSAAVRGTFSGTVKATGKVDIFITGGEFYVWRAN